MRIAMFTDAFYPTLDGVVIAIDTTVRALRELGHEVFVFAPAGPPPPPAYDQVIWLPARPYRSYPGYYLSIYPSDTNAQLRRLNVDLIHAHSIAFMGIRALFAGRTLALPTVLTYHTMVDEAIDFYKPIPIPPALLMRLVWIYVRNFLKRPEAVVAPTEAVLRELAAHGVRLRRTATIPTGVDVERFRPDLNGEAVRLQHHLSSAEVILHVGRLAYEKRIELLFQALRLLRQSRPRARLLLVGDGPARPFLEEQARTLGVADRVTFAGRVSAEALPHYYAAADLFGIASRFETQGLVLLEAFASGLPVAGINHRAIPEILAGCPAGYLFEDGPESCAEALEHGLERGRSVAVEARRRAEELSAPHCAERLVALYQELLDS